MLVGVKYGKQLLHILHNNKRMHDMGTWRFGDTVKHILYDISRILQIINTIRSVVNFVVDWIYTYSAELFIPLPHTKKKHSNTDLVEN